MPPQQQSTNPPTFSPIPPAEEKSWGPIIGSIIIVVIILAGGVYIWGSRLAPLEENIETPDAQTEALRMQGTSDEVGSIEADLQATNLNDIDAGISDVDAEIQSIQ